MNTSNRVEKLITNGPRGDFEQYGNCLKEIGRAKKYLRLQGSSFKASPEAFAQLDQLEFTGQLKCDDALVNLISKFSVP
ncbi:MAG: hypothetical protein NXI00_23865, partial [Cytophagales bacterium]|nr:hypothetical protein [Cytophagales bacterium]